MSGCGIILRLALAWLPTVLAATTACCLSAAHQPMATALACVATLILAGLAMIDLSVPRS